MSLLIVGTTALDSIKTPHSENPRLLGGSASFAAVAASAFTRPHLVGVVGKDFPARYINLYRRHEIDLSGLQRAPGQTFHWSGEYEVNMNHRRTLDTVLGVLEHFSPVLTPAHTRLPYVLLANIAPAVQSRVLDQMRRPKFVMADTMDLWLNIALPDLLSLLRRVDALVLNDGEARQLAGQDNLINALPCLHRLGPRYVIIKKGEHGSILSGPDGLFLAPAYPLKNLVDPTGAGDSFAGALMGYLASQGGAVKAHLRDALLHGSAAASFCCEGFGLRRLAAAGRAGVAQRVRELRKLTAV